MVKVSERNIIFFRLSVRKAISNISTERGDSAVACHRLRNLVIIISICKCQNCEYIFFRGLTLITQQIHACLVQSESILIYKNFLDANICFWKKNLLNSQYLP